MAKRFLVQGYGSIARGEYEIARHHELRRAKRVARAYDGCVIDTEAADAIVYASPGYKRRVGVGHGGGHDPRAVQWRHSTRHPLGARVPVPWLAADGAPLPEPNGENSVDEESYEEWEDDDW